MFISNTKATCTAINNTGGNFNIWAENTATGETVSIVSDNLKQGTDYNKLYLPPGMYTLHVNAINYVNI